MKFRKFGSVALAAALMATSTAIVSYAEVAGSPADAIEASADGKDWTWRFVVNKAEEKGVADKVTEDILKIAGIRYYVTFVDPVTQDATGAVCANSNSTGWKQIEWGNGKPIVPDWENGIIEYKNDGSIFASADEYAQLWFKTWEAGKISEMKKIEVLDKDGNVIWTVKNADGAFKLMSAEDIAAEKAAEEAAAAEAAAAEAAAAEETAAPEEAPAETTVEEVAEEEFSDDEAVEEEEVEEASDEEEADGNYALDISEEELAALGELFSELENSLADLSEEELAALEAFAEIASKPAEELTEEEYAMLINVYQAVGEALAENMTEEELAELIAIGEEYGLEYEVPVEEIADDTEELSPEALGISEEDLEALQEAFQLIEAELKERLTDEEYAMLDVFDSLTAEEIAALPEEDKAVIESMLEKVSAFGEELAEEFVNSLSDEEKEQLAASIAESFGLDVAEAEEAAPEITAEDLGLTEEDLAQLNELFAQLEEAFNQLPEEERAALEALGQIMMKPVEELTDEEKAVFDEFYAAMEAIGAELAANLTEDDVAQLLAFCEALGINIEAPVADTASEPVITTGDVAAITDNAPVATSPNTGAADVAAVAGIAALAAGAIIVAKKRK